MLSFNKAALIELAKSVGRFLYFGVLGLLVQAITTIATSGAVNDISVDVAGTQVQVGTVVALVAMAVAKAIDRYRHADPSTASNGIAPTFLQR